MTTELPARPWQRLVFAAGLATMFGSTLYRLALTVWSDDGQGHGPIILAVSAWLVYRRRAELVSLPSAPRGYLGWTILALSLLGYVFGRVFYVATLEVAALLGVLLALVLVLKGWPGLKLTWFPIFFLVFMIPLPGALVQAMTMPLKIAVSAVAEEVMHALGYPISRSGVILFIGQYQLLVAEACAGLNTIFSLEALGLLYMNLMNYTQPWRNIALATLIVPISFVANVIRVIVLVLVTYYFGDAAGQGFMHGFAGMLLFAVALALTLSLDSVLGWTRRFRRDKLLAG